MTTAAGTATTTTSDRVHGKAVCQAYAVVGDTAVNTQKWEGLIYWMMMISASAAQTCIDVVVGSANWRI